MRAVAPLILVLMAAPAGACREREEPAARAGLEEATITAEVRSRLLMADGLKLLPLEVDTRGGTVSVRGAVRDRSQERLIQTLAAAVKGVRRVELELSVVPAADSSATARRAAPSRGAPAAAPGPRAPAPAAPQGPLPSLDEAG